MAKLRPSQVARQAQALSPQYLIYGPWPGTNDQEIDATEQHGKVGPSLMHHAPEASALDILGEMEHPHVVADKDRQLG